MGYNNCTGKIDGNRIALDYALFLRRCWRREIEKAINEVKNAGRKNGLSRWFQRRWYIAQAVDRKRSLRTGQIARW